MNVLFWSIFLFCVAFLLHLVMWKVRLPKRQTRTLLQIFFGILFIGLSILWMGAGRAFWGGVRFPQQLSEYLHIVLFVTSFTLAYMITYSALEVDSPSLVMIMSIADAGPQGLDKRKFQQLMTDERLIIPRVRDLIRDKLVYMEGEKYKLTPKGVLFARIFIMCRQLSGMSHKGG